MDHLGLYLYNPRIFQDLTCSIPILRRPVVRRPILRRPVDIWLLMEQLVGSRQHIEGHKCFHCNQVRLDGGLAIQKYQLVDNIPSLLGPH